MFEEHHQNFINTLPKASARIFSVMREAGMRCTCRRFVEVRYNKETASHYLVGIVEAPYNCIGQFVIRDSGDLNECQPEHQRWLVDHKQEWLSRKELITLIQEWMRYGTK